MAQPTITISDEVKGVIEAALKVDTGDSNTLTLGAPGSLPAPLYKQVAKVLEQLGLKWDKKRKLHVAPSPVRDLLSEALNIGSVVDVKRAEKQFQFFPTVSEVADMLAGEVLRKVGAAKSLTVLEPSVGAGELILALDRILPAGIELEITACELDTRHTDSLLSVRKTLSKRCILKPICWGDFMDSSLGKDFDVVIMNPPFSRGRDILHIDRAVSLLRSGGVCVALAASTSWDSKVSAIKQLVGRIENTCLAEIARPRVKAGADTNATSNLHVFSKL